MSWKLELWSPSSKAGLSEIIRAFKIEAEVPSAWPPVLNGPESPETWEFIPGLNFPSEEQDDGPWTPQSSCSQGKSTLPSSCTPIVRPPPI